MIKIAVLITVFNRKKETIKCLEHLYASSLVKDLSMKVFLTDDASTDGTQEAILAKFPEVIILEGNGYLFWNRGMINSWNVAAQQDFDYYLWLNNDTYLFPHALAELLAAAKEKKDAAIVCGSTCSTNDKQTITYGGRRLNKGLLTPNGELQNCDYFNGNIVLISQQVYEQLGTHDEIFHHALGDFDYGLRAKKKGIQSFVAPHVLGECNEHEEIMKWRNPITPLIDRFKLLYSPLGNNPIEFFIYEKRHKGVFIAFFHFLTNHLRATFPILWIKLKQY